MKLLCAVVGLLACCSVLCFPTEKEINRVALYIETLQERTVYKTIYDLFGVNARTPEKELKKVQNRMIRECHLMKKNNKQRFGKDISVTDAKTLILGGYEILTDKNLRAAYTWILEEAPADFMRHFTERNKKAPKPVFSMPSGVSFLVLAAISYVVFDVISTVMPQKESELEKKQKKKGKKKGAMVPRQRKTFLDTRTYRALSRVFSVFRRTKISSEAQKQA